jgi:hypothetical protein
MFFRQNQTFERQNPRTKRRFEAEERADQGVGARDEQEIAQPSDRAPTDASKERLFETKSPPFAPKSTTDGLVESLCERKRWPNASVVRTEDSFLSLVTLIQPQSYCLGSTDARVVSTERVVSSTDAPVVSTEGSVAPPDPLFVRPEPVFPSTCSTSHRPSMASPGTSTSS